MHLSCGAARGAAVLASVPPSALLHFSPNVQLVPSIRILDLCSGLVAAARNKQSAAVAAAAAAVAAVAAAAANNGTSLAEADDAKATRARLYSLYDFVAEHGRLPEVQDSHKGVAVGQWAEQCRQRQKQQALETELADALQSIPGWSWEPQMPVLSGRFEQHILQLLNYHQRHGRLPPTRSSSRRSAEDEYAGEQAAATAICRELSEQRKRGVLTQQQIDTVGASVPGWRWDPRVRAPPLDVMIASLQDFVAEHGRLPKQYEKLPDGLQLGEWCTARRGEYGRGQLEVDVAAALASQVPGWTWNQLDTAFEANLEALMGFAAAYGRMPTQRETWDGVRIGAWCNKRRLQYKTGNMPADRVAALEAVPGWWWSCEQMPDVQLDAGSDA